MMRFFVDKKEGDYFILSKDVLQHIKVTRVEEKEFICVFEGKFHKCKLEGNVAKIIDIIDENHEFNEEVVVAAAIINTKRFEWLIQKATELGATKLIPLITERVEQKLGNDIDKKVQRWNEISRNAAEQSFRNYSMEVTFPTFYKNVFDHFYKNKYIAHEKEIDSKVPISIPQNCIFLIGPEGGFSDQEVDLAISRGYIPISLGKRILRAETAPLFLLSRVEQN
ncbi:16S rRNA (uracil(1498)-N(3))-methyltransferase [Mycoplasma procyoni]|uniref:16S rRNA (uracil(1498)-N(3))-methyltransferase n=1 Tax=Mycoplasma procyoni TaxID=568784 RepID=UPI00197B2596|nr:16S rRNA (uracil(1498)-N(3))-methyltransferase [Mycoplasma procyoni]MBN3534521.1 16S rRNA (uracil(1498)-N(3))-methyltransferase [Mycoplasma procyoni]